MTDLSDLLKAPGAAFEAEDDFEAINALYLERGWGDGLPIVPPTSRRVERMDFDFPHAVHLGEIANTEKSCRHGGLSRFGLLTLPRHPPH